MSDYLPEDIQLKVLKHLPVQTLLRFRCVCKWWKQVIDSQSFIQDHLTIQETHYLIFDNRNYKCFEYLIANPCKLLSFAVLASPIPEPLCLLGTLHGIICLYDQCWCNYVLWNPSIKKLMRVGMIGSTVDWYDCDDIDGNDVGPCCGFWIDPLTLEFRIIKFRLFDRDDLDDVCFVYSSIRGEWKEIPVRDEYKWCYTKETAPAVVMDNVGYWTVYHHSVDEEGEGMVNVVVLSFDFRREIFLEPFESFHIDVWWERPVLCNRNGSLSLVFMIPGNLFGVFSWIEDKWVQVHTLCLFPVLENFMWRGEDVVEQEEKMRALATVTGLLSSDSADMVLCASLMIQLREADAVVVANGFVPSLIFPAAAEVLNIVQ